jgi:hypothetical protein
MTKFVHGLAFFVLASLQAQDTASDEKLRMEKKLAEAKAQILTTQMIAGKTVKGAPYSAQAVNETVQVLADGNRIKRTNSTVLYRDSQGRERREEAVGSDGVPRSILISDPSEGVSYMLEPRSKVARKANQIKTMSIVGDGRGGAGVGVGVGVGRGEGAVIVADHMETQTLSFSTAGSGPDTFVFSTQEVSSSKAKTDQLGTRVIEGVSAEGTRTTLTIPAGQIGNEQDIVTVNERWYSPELHVVVMSTRSDPRTGTTTYKLTNVIRSEPSPTLFQVPPDYTVNDVMRRPMGIAVKPEEQ